MFGVLRIRGDGRDLADDFLELRLLLEEPLLFLFVRHVLDRDDLPGIGPDRRLLADDWLMKLDETLDVAVLPLLIANGVEPDFLRLEPLLPFRKLTHQELALLIEIAERVYRGTVLLQASEEFVLGERALHGFSDRGSCQHPASPFTCRSQRRSWLLGD